MDKWAGPIALLSVFLGALGVQLTTLKSWEEAQNPVWIGMTFVQLGTLLKAILSKDPRDGQ